MKNKYIKLIAELDNKTVDEYRVEGQTPDTMIAGAIFFAIINGTKVATKELSKEIGEKELEVKPIFDNLIESGYIVDNKMHLYLENDTYEELIKEYNLFCMAGAGFVKRK